MVWRGQRSVCALQLKLWSFRMNQISNRHTFTQLQAAKCSQSFPSRSSGVILGPCLAQGMSRLVAEPPPPPTLPQPDWDSRIIIWRSEEWLRWQPEGEKTDIKMEETLSAVTTVITWWSLMLKARLFVFVDLTRPSILIMQILRHAVWI